VVPRALLSERLVARNELVRCNTDGDEAADDAQDHIFVRRTVASLRQRNIYHVVALLGADCPTPDSAKTFEPAEPPLLVPNKAFSRRRT
jgi:hypothetical protein